MPIHELHHVLVRGDDVDVMAERAVVRAERADDVVSLVAFGVDDGNAKGLERAADIGLLLNQVGRGLGAVGLVAGVLGGLKLLCLNVELLHVLQLAGDLMPQQWRADVVDRGKVRGWKSARSLLIMFTKTYVAAVGMPVRVVIGRERCMAW